MRWNKFEAVQEMLSETVRVPDTYITVSRMLPKGREVQVDSHPWDDWEDVHRWLKKTARSLDPSPEGVKLRTRIFKKGGKPLRSVVSLVQGRGKGPASVAAPSATPTPATATVPQAPVPSHSCPACVATQALLVAKQLQVVDLDARLKRSRRDRLEVDERVSRLKAKLRELRAENGQLQEQIVALVEYRDTIMAAIAQLPASEEDAA